LFDLLEERLGYRFRDVELLTRALTHPSALSGSQGEETESPLSYQRLEFLGDAVIELVVREALLREYPEDDEGQLTRRKIEVVSADNLCRRAIDLELASFVETGPSLERIDVDGAGATILADVLESLVGAVYLDGGLESVRVIVEERILTPTGLSRASSAEADSKSRLQERCLSRHGELPEYRIVEKEGPDHAPSYVAEVLLLGKLLGRGRGRTKKLAHQDAARSALDGQMTEEKEEE
jgi:ribonuclease-3